MTETLLFKDEVYEITGCAMDVLNTLGHGFQEKVYENAIAVAFDRKGILYNKQKEYEVLYEEVSVGRYVPDFVVNDTIIVELKTVDRIGDLEKGQVLNYLKVTGLRVGVILNFKKPKLEW